MDVGERGFIQKQVGDIYFALIIVNKTIKTKNSRWSNYSFRKRMLLHMIWSLNNQQLKTLMNKKNNKWYRNRFPKKHKNPSS